MTERELLEQLLNEVKELKTTQNEMKIAQCDISERLDAINMKCDITRKKVDDLALDMKLMERGIRTDIRKLQDTTETIVVVLQGQGLLPKALVKQDIAKAAVRKIYFLYCGLSLLCFMELRGIDPCPKTSPAGSFPSQSFL